MTVPPVPITTRQARGIQPGDHVAILSPTSRGLVTAIQACWLVGAASMVLPLPMRMGSLDEFVQGTRARIRHGDAKLLLLDPQLAAFYEPDPTDPPVALLGERGGARCSRCPPRWLYRHRTGDTRSAGHRK